MTAFQFDFMKVRTVALLFSLTLIVISITSLATRGLNLGLDFTGGTLIEVRYQQPADLSLVREQLSAAGFKNYNAVHFGAETDVLVRLQQNNDPLLGDKVLEVLRSGGVQVESRRVDYVGSQVGDELMNQGGLGMLAAVMVMMIYIAVRFQSKFSIGAAIALVHDVIITLGCFSVFGWNFDLTVLAAILALIGYSINDTIVVFDRIRENLRMPRKLPILELINNSVNETLGRTINTSLTTVLVLVALFLFGGEAVHDFSLALIIGIVIGTYSSIYIASAILVMMNVSREDLLVVERKEGIYDDGMP